MQTDTKQNTNNVEKLKLTDRLFQCEQLEKQSQPLASSLIRPVNVKCQHAPVCVEVNSHSSALSVI